MKPNEIKALMDVSMALGVRPDSLSALISFESNWNPKAVNPYTGASGLIQFMPATAQGLGFKGIADLLKQTPDIESQLRGPVLRYLNQFKPFASDADLFLSVFYPKARKMPIDAPLPDSVRAVNPGINTPGDYVRKVYAHSGIKKYGPSAAIIALILAIPLIYLILKQGG